MRLDLSWCANNDVSHRVHCDSSDGSPRSSIRKDVGAASFRATAGNSVDRELAVQHIDRTGDRPQLSMRVLRSADSGCYHGQRD